VPPGHYDRGHSRAGTEGQTGCGPVRRRHGRALRHPGHAGEQRSARKEPCGPPSRHPPHALAEDPIGARQPPHGCLSPCPHLDRAPAPAGAHPLSYGCRRPCPHHAVAGDPVGAHPPSCGRLPLCSRHDHAAAPMADHPVPRHPKHGGGPAAAHRRSCGLPTPSPGPGAGAARPIALQMACLTADLRLRGSPSRDPPPKAHHRETARRHGTAP
jgi:hypothetical protein